MELKGVSFSRNGKFLSVPDSAFTATSIGPNETFTAILSEGPSPPTPPTPPPTPTPGTDAIDLPSAVWMAGDSPDTRSWPIIDTIRSTTIDPSQPGAEVLTLDFPGRFTWPIVQGPEGGAIQFTCVMGVFIDGAWRLCPVTVGTGAYNPTGPLLQPEQVPKNLTYFVGLPMQGYQPSPGELVAFYCTTGAVRRSAIFAPVTGRTNVVKVPFQAGSW